MLDYDLALLYEVEIRVLNNAVKINIEKFLNNFMFQLTEQEWEAFRVRSKIMISPRDFQNLSTILSSIVKIIGVIMNKIKGEFLNIRGNQAFN